MVRVWSFFNDCFYHFISDENFEMLTKCFALQNFKPLSSNMRKMGILINLKNKYCKSYEWNKSYGCRLHLHPLYSVMLIFIGIFSKSFIWIASLFLFQVYYISRGTLKTANPQYNSTKNEYEMTLNSDSLIQPCEDSNSIDLPLTHFQFVQIGKLDSHQANDFVGKSGVVFCHLVWFT